MVREKVAKGLVAVQEDWADRGKQEQGRKEDAKETVAQTMPYGMLFRNKLWKLWCQEVVKIELPAEKKMIQERIAGLKERSTEVSLRDQKLFEEQNVPGNKDSLDRMVQGMRSVENSIERGRKVENCENRRISNFMNFSGGERA